MIGDPINRHRVEMMQTWMVVPFLVLMLLDMLFGDSKMSQTYLLTTLILIGVWFLTTDAVARFGEAKLYHPDKIRRIIRTLDAMMIVSLLAVFVLDNFLLN